MKKIFIVVVFVLLCGCGKQDAQSIQYTDPAKAPDGVYIVTFENGLEEILWVKNGQLAQSVVIAESQFKRIKGHYPVNLEPIRR